MKAKMVAEGEALIESLDYLYRLAKEQDYDLAAHLIGAASEDIKDKLTSTRTRRRSPRRAAQSTH